MIRLRVEWRCECSGCGTELVSDFFDDSVDVAVCPWCGCIPKTDHDSANEELRKYIAKAIKEIESKANRKIPV